MSAPISEDLLSILADPETHEKVALATDEQLSALLDRIRGGKARRRAGGELPTQLDGALLSQGNRVAYPIVEGVPDFLIDDRIELDEPL